MTVDVIFYNGQFKGVGTFAKKISAVAIKNKLFFKFGSDKEILALKNDSTKIIDLKQKTVIPGLNDSHIHLIRGGLNFNMELRWDGIKNLSDALFILKNRLKGLQHHNGYVLLEVGLSFNLKKSACPLLMKLILFQKIRQCLFYIYTIEHYLIMQP